MYDQLLESLLTPINTLLQHILSIYIFNNNSRGLYFFMTIVNISNERFANHLKH